MLATLTSTTQDNWQPQHQWSTTARTFSPAWLRALPQTFWERSMFVHPRDRDVVCHASAWDIDQVDDLRVKMCIEATTAR